MSMSTFLSGLEASNWLKHIKAVLDTSLFIAKAIIRERASVLVHCSDGWDRTAQTCSLASIILDPYYRTIHGFQVQFSYYWFPVQYVRPPIFPKGIVSKGSYCIITKGVLPVC